jgi:Zn finger protein HypA/HybF involved in hydrogenase expression
MVTFNIDAWRAHKRIPDCTVNVKCEMCEFNTNNPTAMQQHMVKHAPPKHACGMCDHAPFKFRKDLRIHIKKVHPEGI